MEVTKAVRDAGLPTSPAEKAACREVLEIAVQMFSPFVPHLAEELWQHLGHSDESLFRVEWPAVDAEALVMDEVEIAVQVNGKLRARWKAPGRGSLPRGSSRNLVHYAWPSSSVTD